MDALFEQYTRDQRLQLIQECRQSRVLLLNLAQSYFDTLHTLLPTPQRGWHERTRAALFALARAVDETVSATHPAVARRSRPVSKKTVASAPRPTAPRVSLRGFLDAAPVVDEDDNDVNDRVAAAIWTLSHDCIAVLGRRHDIDATTFETQAQATAFLTEAFLPHMHEVARAWGAAGIEHERRSFLADYPNANFPKDADKHNDAVDEYYAAVRTSPEYIELTRATNLNLAYMAEAALYGSGSSLSDTLAQRMLTAHPTVVARAPNQPYPLIAEGPSDLGQAADLVWQRIVENIHLPAHDGRTSLAQLLHAAGWLPGVLMAAAKGDLPWLVHAPLTDPTPVYATDGSVSAADTHRKTEEARLASPPSAAVTVYPQRPPTRMLVQLAERMFALPANDDSAPDLTLRDWCAQYDATSPLVLARLFSFYAHEPLLEAVGPSRTVDADTERAVSEVTRLGLLLDALNVALHATGAHGMIEAAVLENLRMDFVVRAEDHLPGAVFEARHAIQEVLQYGAGYGPIDVNLAVGTSAQWPAVTRETIALDTVLITTRAQLHALLYRNYFVEWETRRDTRSPYAVFAARFKRASPTRLQYDPVDVRYAASLLDTGMKSSVVRSLGHLTVGAAGYATLPSFLGVPHAWASDAALCRRSALTLGVPRDDLRKMIESANRYAAADAMGMGGNALMLGNLGACMALIVDVTRNDATVLPLLDRSQLDPVDEIVQHLEAVVRDLRLSRPVTMDRLRAQRIGPENIPADQYLLQELPRRLPPRLFHNAMLLKHALRGRALLNYAVASQ